jgi:hypothetical protein
VLLIGTLGVSGAAWATLTAFVFMAAATYVVARRLHRVSVDWLRVGSMAALTVAAAAWAASRVDPLSVERVALDVAISITIGVVALVVGSGPFRRLRVLTRDAVASASGSVADADRAASASG